MRALTCFALVVSLFACGGTSDGSPCTTPGATQCSGASTLLVCEGATWRGYACPSCEGTTCNWKNAMNGASCPATSAGDGWCPLEGRVLSCYFSSAADAGVFVESACSNCTAGKSLRELGRCSGSTCSCQ